MKRSASAVMAIAAMAVWASAASAQSKFDGKWAVDMEKTQASNPAPPAGAPPGRGGMPGGMTPMTIAVVGDELSITRVMGQEGAEVTTKYKLDGSEQTVAGPRGESKVKAMKDGDKITITTTREGQNGPTTTTAVYMIEGDYLVIATTSPARGGGEPMTRKQYFKKAS
jgi:hypothetical protein